MQRQSKKIQFLPQGPRLSRVPRTREELSASPRIVLAQQRPNDSLLFTIFLAFLVCFIVALVTPTIVVGSLVHSTVGRSISVVGFVMAAASFGAATFGPGGLENNFVVAVALSCGGFGLMIGGIIGDTVRLW